MNLKVSVLFVADVEVTVLLEITDDQAFASFVASVEANVGFGTVTTSINAEATVDALAIGDGTPNGSFLDADWNLDFNTKWDTAQWLEDLGRLIWEGLKEFGKQLLQLWNTISGFVTDVFNAVKDIAKAIGGAIADVLETINEAIDGVQNFVNDGIDVVVDFFNDKGLQAVGALVGAVGDVLNFAIDKFQQGVDIVIGIANGDWSAVGDAAAALFGFSKSVSNVKVNSYNPERYWDDISNSNPKPGPFPCKLRYQTVRLVCFLPCCAAVS
mmetsp:Transcript_27833/g.39104  ORF Transcript_27833/g.39104 Transcript_27833/m.39104 type:complete len:270 (+) Transcript_27833:2253-3062(+)